MNFKKGKKEVMLLRTAQHMARYGNKLTIIHKHTVANLVTQDSYLAVMRKTRISTLRDF